MKTSLAFAAATIFAAGIFFAPAACAQDDPASNPSDVGDPALIEAAAAPPQTVAPADVLKMLDDKRSDIAIVDTQPPSGFADTHIPGALNYPWVMRIKSFPIPLPRNKTLVFYGSCPNDTADIVKQLAEYGYFNVKIMDGGLDKWMAMKYPVTRGASEQPTPDLSQLVTKPPKNNATAK
ncbi:MAG TPA: rhodanese-like domain-containing protein [Candidatus Acidoferrales bacterium]|nr:rhodanese-like domain-containing protein [Candidatus Acidoferrales bacterium]